MMDLAGLIGLAVVALAPPSAADAVTLKDGQVVLGQVVDSDRRGPLLMLVRRSWAEANLPDRAAAWRKAEEPTVRRGEAQRRDRLAAWRRDRLGNAAAGDRILAWLDRELARPAEGAGTVLIGVRLGRADVKAVDRKPPASARMLRLGWLSGFEGVETMATADLAEGLEARGYARDGTAPVSIASLLPPQPSLDSAWRTRRAATEVANDPGGRFLLYRGAILPEPPPGEAPPAGAALEAAASSLKELLGEAPVDPLPAKLRELAGRGRAGAIVTRLDMAPDFATVQVHAALWVREGNGQWTTALLRSSTVRPDDLPANAGAPIADDPQVRAAFGVIEALGLGEVPADLKRRSLAVGAATRAALGRARQALDLELEGLVIPLEEPRDPGPAPKAR